MSGIKAYTMREMKGIVEYLTEHRAYSEVRGRKMWMDFACSPQTTRTWQSLKETFLKRILPDIQNPYYKLTREQVASFKQGLDVEAKEKNKLTIQREGKESSKNENQKEIEPSSTSAEKCNKEDDNRGENIKSETITARNRSSADTFILDAEDQKKTTEELLAELEEPTTSMKDCINFEYSEPPSVVREVLDDFVTESEGSDRDPQMEIVEDANENDDADVTQEVIVVEDSENLDIVELIEDAGIVVEGGMEVDIGPTFDHEVVKTTEFQGLNKWLDNCAQEQEVPTEANENEKGEVEQPTESNEEAITEEVREVTEPIVIEDSENLTDQNNSDKNKTTDITNSTTKTSLGNDNNNQASLCLTSDTIIPNNQEEISKESSKGQKTNSKYDILAPMKDAASRKRSTSQEKTVSKKKKIENGVEKTNGDTIEKTPPSSTNTEALFEALKNSENPDSTVQDAQVIDESPQNKNPCLKSVSLFDEQFNTTKYSDSDEETPIPNNKEKISNITPEDKNEEPKEVTTNGVKEVAVDPPEKKQDKTSENTINLEETEDTPQKEEKKVNPPTQEKVSKTNPNIQNQKTTINPPVAKAALGIKENIILLKSNSDSEEERNTHSSRKERSKHLAQAFGFVPGTSITAAQRRRSLRSRNRTKSQRTSCTLHEASDWDGSISEPELAEDYISPPRGRRNRYARKYRKPQSGRIMSLDEDGGLFVVHGNKIIPLVKNGKALTFVTYDSLGCSEEEEELMWRQKYIDEKKKAALLKKQLEEITEAGTSRSKSPILQETTRSNSVCTSNTLQNATNIEMNKQMNIKQIGNEGKIQVTLSKSNEETINLEGHWPQVLPIVQQVMSIFYKQGEAKPQQQKEDISGLVTPIIPVIDLEARKVEDLEKEIFKEIEEHDKKEKSDITNVTKRKAGRPKKNPSISSDKSEKAGKRPKKSKKSEEKPETDQNLDIPNQQVDENNDKDKDVDVTRNKLRKHSIALAVSDRISVDSELAKTSPKDSEIKISENKIETDKNSAKSNIEPRVTRGRKSGNETDTSSRTVTTRLSSKSDPEEDIRYMLPPEPKTRKSNRITPTKARSEPHAASEWFRSDTTGYQDSDPSPAKVNITRRKTRTSLTIRKGKHVPRRRSFPTLSIHDMSLDSSNSSYFIPRKSRSHSTVDSAVYKTESYQILMGNPKVCGEKLDVIDENKSDEHLQYIECKDSSNRFNIVVDVGSSSNISLPLSPELSVVENLSISREMIRNENHPTINEIQGNDIVSNIYNQYLISDMDVSVPLMLQDCELLNPKIKTKVKNRTPVTVSGLLDKVCSVNMSVNNTLSDTLDRKLRDLLLESAKKMSETNKENMDVDEVEPKRRGKKRCSTPRKRSAKTKTKPTVGPVIDEHMESCSHTGRNSCPPVITFISIDENANNSSDVQLTKKPKRVKKDIIKVKIQRPTTKRGKEMETSQISVYTDSGINETSSEIIHGESVDLIHNHSETCLQANECINSVEFVENSRSESVISINSTASLESELLKVMGDAEVFSGDCMRNNQDKSAEKSSGEVYGTPTETVYHSPIASNCSLITEDLSDEAPMPPTKWFLLSEDDTNTNTRPEQMTSNSRVSNFSANLKQLFPVTCAVPDLSTISEFSRENEGSRKNFDTDDDTRFSDFQTF